jgi:hypothetical protein
LTLLAATEVFFSELQRSADGRRIARERAQHFVTDFSETAWCDEAAVANQVELEVSRRAERSIQRRSLSRNGGSRGALAD